MTLQFDSIADVNTAFAYGTLSLNDRLCLDGVIYRVIRVPSPGEYVMSGLTPEEEA